MAIDDGYHGETDLAGLNIAAVFRWPGPIHEGKGECAAFVDERASEAQRQALLTIMTGGDTDPFATVFAVFASTITTMHKPGFVPIEFDVDVEGRQGRRPGLRQHRDRGWRRLQPSPLPDAGSALPRSLPDRCCARPG